MNMFANHVAFLALDISAERSRDAERRARLLAGAGPDFAGPGQFRHDLARLAALVSRQSAQIARGLDDRVTLDHTQDGSSPA